MSRSGSNESFRSGFFRIPPEVIKSANSEKIATFRKFFCPAVNIQPLLYTRMWVWGDLEHLYTSENVLLGGTRDLQLTVFVADSDSRGVARTESRYYSGYD